MNSEHWPHESSEWRRDGPIHLGVTASYGDQPPRLGQDIEGQLWLQGRLCYAPQAREPGKRKL